MMRGVSVRGLAKASGASRVSVAGVVRASGGVLASGAMLSRQLLLHLLHKSLSLVHHRGLVSTSVLHTTSRAVVGVVRTSAGAATVHRVHSLGIRAVCALAVCAGGSASAVRRVGTMGMQTLCTGGGASATETCHTMRVGVAGGADGGSAVVGASGGAVGGVVDASASVLAGGAVLAGKLRLYLLDHALGLVHHGGLRVGCTGMGSAVRASHVLSGGRVRASGVRASRVGGGVGADHVLSRGGAVGNATADGRSCGAVGSVLVGGVGAGGGAAGEAGGVRARSVCGVVCAGGLLAPGQLLLHLVEHVLGLVHHGRLACSGHIECCVGLDR